MLDSIDLKLNALLNENRRMPRADIARNIGNISSSTIANRINSLIENTIIKVRAIVDPEMVSYRVLAVFEPGS